MTRNRKAIGRVVPYYGIICAIVLFGFFLRLWGLDWQSLWWDELSTWNRSAMPIPNMMADLLAKRNHMPFYFLVMRAWSFLGNDSFILRYFSVICGLIGISLIFRLGKYLNGSFTGLLAAFFLALSPLQIWYGQEARMYTLMVACAIAANWFLLKALRNNSIGYWFSYAVSMCVGALTHYFFFLLFVVHYIFFVFHFRKAGLPLRNWIISAGSAAIVAALWVGLALSNSAGKLASPPWIRPSVWNEPFYTLVTFATGRTIEPGNLVGYALLLFFLLGVSVVIIRQALHWPKTGATNWETISTLGARLSLGWLVIPILIIFLVSLDWPIPQKPRLSIYTDRYLLFVQPALLLLAAWGFVILAKSIHRIWILPVFAVVIALLSAVALQNLYFNPEYSREDWRAALERLETEALPEDILLITPDHLLPLAYYVETTPRIVELPTTSQDLATTEAFEKEMQDRLMNSDTSSDRAWLISNFYINDPHGFPQSRNVEVENAKLLNPYKSWMESHYEVSREWEYPGINLTLYDLKNSN